VARSHQASTGARSSASGGTPRTRTIEGPATGLILSHTTPSPDWPPVRSVALIERDRLHIHQQPDVPNTPAPAVHHDSMGCE
jgi:hypothetical protein